MPSFGAVLPGEVIWDLPTNLSADPGMEWGTTVSPSTPKIEQTPAGGMATDTPWLYTQPFRPEAGGLSFIYLGVGITSAVLFSVTVWTMYTLAALARDPASPASFSVQIIAHQWWWEVRYDDGS